MERVRDPFLDILRRLVSLEGKKVLVVGCGKGEYAAQIAAHCERLVGIDPNKKAIRVAIGRRIANAKFYRQKIQRANLGKKKFDVVIFELSLHHVAEAEMAEAISRAIGLTKQDGHVVFLEPDTEGSFFQAEIKFGACDGDERDAKEAAYLAMQKHPALVLVEEVRDWVMILFDSIDEFVASMRPQKELHILESFLSKHNHFLKADIRINIYRRKPRP